MAQEIIKKIKSGHKVVKPKSTVLVQLSTFKLPQILEYISQCTAAKTGIAVEVLHVGWAARSVLGLIMPSLRHTSPVNGPLCPGLESKSCRMPLCTWPQKHLRAEGFKVLTGFEILWFSNICDWRLEKYVAMQLQSNLHFSLYPTNF